MIKRTERTMGTQGAYGEVTALARLLAPLVDGMTTTRHQLLSWVRAPGWWRSMRYFARKLRPWWARRAATIRGARIITGT
jgi:hypothetical protein